MSQQANPALRKRKLKRAVFIISFLFVPTVNFLVFYVYVNFNSFLMAFQKQVGGETVWSLETIQQVFQRFFPIDDEMKMIFRNTFLTFGIGLCMFVVGFFVSYFLYKKILFYKGFRVLFYLPSILPGVVLCTIYQEMVGINSPLPDFVQRLFSLDYRPEPLADSRFANFFVLLNMVWLSFPGNLILWGGTFSRIPDSVVEAARLDGVNFVQEAFRIIIPCVWPTFSLLLTLQLAGIFGSSGQVFLLTKGDYGTQTFSSWMYIQVYSVTLDPRSNTFNFMSALGMFITLIAAVLSLSLRKFASKVFQSVEY